MNEQQRPVPVMSENEFRRQLGEIDMVFGLRAYERLSPEKQLIARVGIQQRIAACERIGVPFDPAIAREIIEDAKQGRAVYREV